MKKPKNSIFKAGIIHQMVNSLFSCEKMDTLNGKSDVPNDHVTATNLKSSGFNNALAKRRAPIHYQENYESIDGTHRRVWSL